MLPPQRKLDSLKNCHTYYLTENLSGRWIRCAGDKDCAVGRVAMFICLTPCNFFPVVM